MTTLQNKIDFAMVISVNHANPNGDPLDGNRPRTTFDGHGEITDVCLKRKIRNRLQDNKYSIFVQSDERRDDECRSLKDRANSIPELIELDKRKDRRGYARKACETWLDVRSFGQVFAFGKDKQDKKSKDKDEDSERGKDKDTGGTSIPVRGPVTIQSAFSVDPVEISSLQITKSVNLETNEKDPDKKTSDTMGMKHRVDKGIYVTYGSINVQLAELTGFSEKDADALKEALRTLFVNDISSARPDGSMEVLKLVWWKHNCKNGQYSAAKVHRSLTVHPDGSMEFIKLPGLEPEVIDGI